MRGSVWHACVLPSLPGYLKDNMTRSWFIRVAHPESKSRSFQKLRILTVVLFVLVVTGVFWQSTNHDFINYDDPAYVTENNHVKSGLTYQGLKWAFSTLTASNWHPLTWLSHMLDCQLYGLTPMGHHLTNIILHILNTLLLFYLLHCATRDYWRSFFVAALFGLHPLHVESVAWVAERKDVLSTFFLLITLIFYDRYARQLRPLPYVLALVSFALGLMSKPMLVTLPFVMLLWDVWPLNRLKLQRSSGTDGHSGTAIGNNCISSGSQLGLVREKIPFFVLSLVSCIITYRAQDQAGAVAAIHTLPLGFRAVNALLSYVRYIGKMFWPHHLAVIYPLPTTLTIAQGLAAGLALLVITYLACRLARRHAHLLVGWLWYIGTLVPVIGLVQVGKQAMADRYTYIPLIGLFIMISWGVPALLRSWPPLWVVLPAAACLFLSALTIATWVQIGYWKNGVTLFSHAAGAVADNSIAYRNLGNALAQRGDFADAERSFQEALRIYPDDEETHTQWGAALAKQKRIEDAIDQFMIALQINSNSADAHYNLGVMFAENRDTAQAIKHYVEALRIEPRREDAHLNLGSIYLGEGNLNQALYHYYQASSLDPYNAEIVYSLGLAYGMNGNLAESIRCFSAAVRIKPDFLEAHYNLGIAFVKAGNLDEGIHHFSEVLRMNPDFKEARRTLQAAIELKGTR